MQLVELCEILLASSSISKFNSVETTEKHIKKLKQTTLDAYQRLNNTT